jgi:hypothetical protein
VNDAGDELVLNLNAVTLLASSTIKKQGSGDMVINSTSFNANGNTIAVDTGKLTLGGTADYSGLAIDVTGLSGSGRFVVGTNSVTLAGLTILGTNIASGVYAPGDDIYTTYAGRLLNQGGTLTVIPEPATVGLFGVALVLILTLRHRS